jgi:hypothetical protein
MRFTIRLTSIFVDLPGEDGGINGKRTYRKNS